MIRRAIALTLGFLSVLAAADGCAKGDEAGLDSTEGEGGGAVCGDGLCEETEDCDACAVDCCFDRCGDGACDELESCADCAADCGECASSCGDGLCDAVEDCSSCDVDCGACTDACGDGFCDPGETCGACEADCGACPASCGDASCDPGESCGNCQADCGACPASCGNASCDANESCSTCPLDCGACPPMCGDATCDANETCSSCEADCGACPPSCGDATCEATEDCASCPSDCGPCACSADAVEPNNGSPQATPVVGGLTYCGLSVCAGDVDWLSFTVTSGLTATIDFVQAYGDLDLEIYSAQNLAYVGGAYSHDDDESVTLTGLGPGKYWARVYGFGGDENADYCFQVSTF